MTNLQSLVSYLACFSLMAMSFALAEKAQRYGPGGRTLARFLRAVVVVGFAVGAGLRQNVGTDYQSYVEAFRESLGGNALEDSINGSFGVEPVFVVLSRLSDRLTSGPEVMFFVYGLITAAGFCYAVRRLFADMTVEVGLTIFVLLCMFMPFTLSAARQGAAMAIFLYGVVEIVHKKAVRGAVYVAIAGVFHPSTFFVAPLLATAWLMFRKRARSPLVAVFPAAALAGLLGPWVIPLVLRLSIFARFDYMLLYTRDDLVIGGTFTLQALLLVGLTILGWKRIAKEKTLSFLYFLAVFGLATYTLSFEVAFAYRVSFFLLPVSCLLGGLVIPRRGRVAYLTGLAAFAMAYFVAIYYIGGRFSVFPLQFE
ncbi:MAG: EpsG family protein [Propionibacteriaceae bacterium]|jgi:hypothetical protein|nr:EpsG family protein [Propionibacteriaceae bacterium]